MRNGEVENKMKPKVISKKTMYESDWMKIILAKLKLANGEMVEWDYIKGGVAVAVVAVDGKKNIYLSKEWRVAWEDYVTQTPAGGAEGKTERSRIRQVHNELREEIGMDAKKVEKLIGPIPMSARQNSIFYLYLATNMFKSKKEVDSKEIIRVVRMPFAKAYKLLLSGKIKTTSYTILGMALAKDKLKIKIK